MLSFKKGDTIVEVLIAVTIFSMVAVAAIALMNRGTATAQQALEITSVRSQIDGQAEALRFLHGSYVANYSPGASYAAGSPAAKYNTILANSTTSEASDFTNLTSCPTAATISKWKFVINPLNSNVVVSSVTPKEATTHAKIGYTSTPAGLVFASSEGLWIEPVRSPSSDSRTGGVGFIDFHIRACWMPPMGSVPITTGTIVRLYDPR